MGVNCNNGIFVSDEHIIENSSFRSYILRVFKSLWFAIVDLTSDIFLYTWVLKCFPTLFIFLKVYYET
jgi:hypothetical protein